MDDSTLLPKQKLALKARVRAGRRMGRSWHRPRGSPWAVQILLESRMHEKHTLKTVPHHEGTMRHLPCLLLAALAVEAFLSPPSSPPASRLFSEPLEAM